MSISVGNLKIVFAGSVGSGKTCSIHAVSDIDVINTEEKASDDVKLLKETTTVALDYGQMKLDDESVLHLYGAPGQSRFDYMWEILSEGALGVIVLISDATARPFEEIDTYLKGFSEQLKSRSLVIGITQTDLNKGHSLDEYRTYVNRYDSNIPVFTVDAREKHHIQILVKTLLYKIDPWLH